jgi:hypothetical protein
MRLQMRRPVIIGSIGSGRQWRITVSIIVTLSYCFIAIVQQYTCCVLITAQVVELSHSTQIAFF